MDELGHKLNQPWELFISSLVFFIYLILLIPLYLKRRKNEQQDQPNQEAQIPKSLESLLMNFGIITLNIVVWWTLYFMNMYVFVKLFVKPNFFWLVLKNSYHILLFFSVRHNIDVLHNTHEQL